MTSPAHVVAGALVVLGTGVVVAACLGALRAPCPFARLHFTTPITSLGGPLIAVGVSVRNGWGLTTGSVLLPVVLMFVTGPLLSSAIARTMAERDRTISTGPQQDGVTQALPGPCPGREQPTT